MLIKAVQTIPAANSHFLAKICHFLLKTKDGHLWISSSYKHQLLLCFTKRTERFAKTKVIIHLIASLLRPLRLEPNPKWCALDLGLEVTVTGCLDPATSSRYDDLALCCRSLCCFRVAHCSEWDNIGAGAEPKATARKPWWWRWGPANCEVNSWWWRCFL